MLTTSRRTTPTKVEDIGQLAVAIFRGQTFNIQYSSFEQLCALPSRGGERI